MPCTSRPPPAHIGALIDDLLRYANRDDVDPITQAAVVHAQFETIHPYGDGNGRIGRILVGWLLVRRLHVVVPPPVSVAMARDVGGYLSGLYQFRHGDRDAWIRWFADTVRASADATVALLARVEELMAGWRDAISHVRRGAAAHDTLALLPRYPIVNAAVVAATLDVSERTARTALEQLETNGIVEPFEVPGTARGRPSNWYAATKLLELVGA